MDRSKVVNMKNTILLIIGLISIILGAIGVFIPVLPTTPFVLLAGGCFSISSPRLSAWLKKSKFFGSYIENYENNTGIPKEVKMKAIVTLWAGIILSMVLIQNMTLNCLLMLIAVCVSIYLGKMKTR
jgi:uncharacterized membrane protein YbaN (DUF454 family)